MTMQRRSNRCGSCGVVWMRVRCAALRPGMAAVDRETDATSRAWRSGGGMRSWRRAVRAHTTKTRERVAADQGAMIGLTYRCFELAAKCDPVIYAVDGLRRVASGQWLED